MGMLDELPSAVLDKILQSVLTTTPSDILTLAPSLSKPIHESACRTTFSSLTLPDDARLVFASPTSALFANPQRYGPYVKALCISDPTSYAPIGTSSNLGLFGEFDVIKEEEEHNIEGLTAVAMKKSDSEVSPISAEVLSTILGWCPNLEEFTWTGLCAPPDALCEYLSSTNLRLRSFAYTPTTTSGTKNLAPKWDALSLPLLSFLPNTLTSLALTRLTQTGAKSLSLLLNALAEDESSTGSLENLELNFVWFDDALCQRIVAAGKKLKRLRIGTQGTKLTDTGILTLLHGLEALEDFGLVDVEGRLSKTLWTKLESERMSKSLKQLTLGIPDAGPSHSWSLDHLQSFASFPIGSLTDLSVLRTIPQDDSVPPASLRVVPRDILEVLAKTAKTLQSFECDWWGWSPEDLKIVLERCSSLQSVKVAFDAPFPKLLALASSIASASELQQLKVVIPPEHLPSPPPSPSLATPGNPLSPSGSPLITRSTPLRGSIGLPPSPTISHPIMRRDSIGKASATYFEPTSPSTSFSQASIYTAEGSPIASIRSIPVLDPALPLLRDMKKLFKRCSGLQELEWIGRGAWVLDTSRSSTPSKTVSLANVKVDFVPPSGPSEEDWEQHRMEEEIVKWKWSPAATDRPGQAWEGETAESLAKDREALTPEKEKEKDLSESASTRPTPPKRKSSANTPVVPVAPPPPVPKSTQVLESPTKTNGKYRRPSNIDVNGSPNRVRPPSASAGAAPNGFPKLNPSKDKPAGHVPNGRKPSGEGQGPGQHRPRAASAGEGERRYNGHNKQRSGSSSGTPALKPGERRDKPPSGRGGHGGRKPSGSQSASRTVPQAA